MKYFFIFITLVFLQGCYDSGDKDIDNFMKRVKSSKPGDFEDIPKIPEYKPRDYTSSSLRSPFQSKVEEMEEIIEEEPIVDEIVEEKDIIQSPRPDAKRKREYLEGFMIDSLQMVGALSKGSYIWGLIKDINGKIHSVQVGDYLGKNSGKIIEISESRIFFIETVENGVGGWMQVRSSLGIFEDNLDNEDLDI